MKRLNHLALPSRVLFVVLLGLLLGVSVVVAGVSIHAHAAPLATLTVTDCTGETGPGRIATVIGSASSGDTVNFSCSGTIPLTSELNIEKNLTLDGSGQTVTLDGGGTTLVLFVGFGFHFTLNALTVAHGNSGDGGGLASSGTLSISNSTISNNSASIDGGGLFILEGTVSISNSTFSNNSAGGFGGGLASSGALSISNSTFSSNSANDGGGLSNSGSGTVSINNSTISNNSASLEGGGLFNNGSTKSKVSISNSTFSSNSAGDSGGGFDNGGAATISSSTFDSNSASVRGGGLYASGSGTVSIGDSTFNHNSAGVAGGGLFIVDGTVDIGTSTISSNSAVDNGGGLNSEGTVSISNSTISGNSANDGGGLFNDTGKMHISFSTIANNMAGGGLVQSGGVFTIKASLVASNGGGNCVGGTLSDDGFNLDTENTCGFSSANHDLVNTNPQLGALANNGGPTQTLALAATSPAIDQIPAASCPVTDQRGFTRPDDNELACDIGAYESGAKLDNDLGLSNVPSDITVNATSPAGAVVTYSLPTVVDEDNPLPTVSCLPISGSTFPIGTTTVTCMVTDAGDSNSPVSKSFKVTVNDTDLGMTNVPSTITVDATSPAGAVVTYSLPTAVDEETPLPTVSCLPISGSTFQIGDTTVTCTVSDADDTPSTVQGSFVVHVKGAAEQINNLCNQFPTLSFSDEGTFCQQLHTVLTALSNGNTALACQELFIISIEVRQPQENGLTPAQVAQIVTALTRIQAVLNCPTNPRYAQRVGESAEKEPAKGHEQGVRPHRVTGKRETHIG